MKHLSPGFMFNLITQILTMKGASAFGKLLWINWSENVAALFGFI